MRGRRVRRRVTDLPTYLALPGRQLTCNPIKKRFNLATNIMNDLTNRSSLWHIASFDYNRLSCRRENIFISELDIFHFLASGYPFLVAKVANYIETIPRLYSFIPPCVFHMVSKPSRRGFLSLLVLLYRCKRGEKWFAFHTDRVHTRQERRGAFYRYIYIACNFVSITSHRVMMP